MTRADAIAAYERLPGSDTTQEPWRGSGPKGFAPDAFAANGARSVVRAEQMLEIDVAGLVTVSEGGIEIERAPDGVTFEPLADHELLGSLVGAENKFTAHNAATWK